MVLTAQISTESPAGEGDVSILEITADQPQIQPHIAECCSVPYKCCVLANRTAGIPTVFQSTMKKSYKGPARHRGAAGTVSLQAQRQPSLHSKLQASQNYVARPAANRNEEEEIETERQSWLWEDTKQRQGWRHPYRCSYNTKHLNCKIQRRGKGELGMG